jgi:hypothetical protein
VSTAQTWAALGVLAAALAIIITLVLRLIDARFDGLRQEMVVRFDSIDRDLQRLYERDRLLAVADAARDFLNVYDQAAPSVQEIEALRAALEEK